MQITKTQILLVKYIADNDPVTQKELKREYFHTATMKNAALNGLIQLEGDSFIVTERGNAALELHEHMELEAFTLPIRQKNSIIAMYKLHLSKNTKGWRLFHLPSIKSMTRKGLIQRADEDGRYLLTPHGITIAKALFVFVGVK